MHSAFRRGFRGFVGASRAHSGRRGYTVEAYDGSTTFLGEGTLWHSTNKLLHINIYGDEAAPPMVSVFDPKTRMNKRFLMPSRIGTVVPVAGKPNLLAVALEDGVYTLDTTTAELTGILNLRAPDEIIRFNDGKCDPQGRFWVGSMYGKQRVDNQGTLYSIDASLTPTPRIKGVTISNGLVWKGNTFYYIDTPLKTIDAFDYEPATGAISNRRTVYRLPADESYGMPDGMALDAAGNLWVASFNGGCVFCIDPEKGTCVREVVFPTPRVTSIAFGGPDFTDMYVTTARNNIPAEKLKEPRYLHAGQLFKVTGLGVKGIPPSEFKIDEKELAVAQAAGKKTTVPVISERFIPVTLRA